MKTVSLFFERYRYKQIYAVLSWVRKRNQAKAVSNPEYLYILLSSYKKCIDLSQRYDVMSWKQIMYHFQNGVQIKKIAVIICERGEFTQTFFNMQEKKNDCICGESEHWYKIFSSPYIEVWEYSNENKKENRPIRFGLDEEEKKIILYCARRALSIYLQKKEGVEMVYKQLIEISKKEGFKVDHFFQKADVDVILWVDGEMRGSRIVEGKTFLEATCMATILSGEDARFKPLTESDLANTQIEIVVLSDLRIPLSLTEITKNEIYADKGYCVEANDKKGWYLPAVFNCANFQDLNHFLTSLVYEKIGDLSCSINNKFFYLFEVFDFIEDCNVSNIKNNSVSTLFASVTQKKQNTEKISPRINIESVHIRIETSLGYLTRLQNPDGYIPSVMTPFTVQKNTMDWVRSSYAVWAWSLCLATFDVNLKGNLSGNKEQLILSYKYLTKYLYTHLTMKNDIRCLSLIYYYKAAVILFDEEEIRRSHKIIMSLIQHLKYDPLLYIQIGIHIFEHPDASNEDFKNAISITFKVLADFTERSKKNSIDLASFADLYNLLELAYKNSKEEELRLRGNQIFEWYKSLQNNNGSFPVRPLSYLSYTRGVSKIAEAFSKERVDINDDVFKSAIAWIESMQYSETENYFVSKSLSANVVGGFRHGYHDANIWNDTTSHYLIALCRIFLSVKNKK